MSDAEILEGVKARALAGESTELGDVPPRLWDAVCESNRLVSLQKWRAGGWHVGSAECPNGCCRFDVLTPPDAVVCKCTRGIRYKVVASYRASNPAPEACE